MIEMRIPEAAQRQRKAPPGGDFIGDQTAAIANPAAAPVQ